MLRSRLRRSKPIHVTRLDRGQLRTLARQAHELAKKARGRIKDEDWEGFLKQAITEASTPRELLRRIAKQEGRHIDFYVSQASRRLAASNGARRLTRLALRRRWRPVGSGVMPEAETDHLIEYLFGGDDGATMAERIDRRLSRLPGLERLGLVTSVRTRTIGAAA